MFNKEFIEEIFINRYGKRPTFMKAFNANCRDLLQNIKPKTTKFFGQLRFNHKLLLEKLPGFCDSFDNGYMLDMFTSIDGVPQEMLYTTYNPSTNAAISSAWSFGQEQLLFENILFDDISLFNQNSFTNNKLVGSLAQPGVASSPKSISTLLTGSNGAFTNSFPTSGGSFVYAPEFVNFVGYIITVGN